MTLPAHIIKVSEIWYKNTKSGKFIHASHIERLAKYYSDKKNRAMKAKISYNKTLKMAQKRWNDEK